ncbi:DUF1214 domain-containing protein, partial [Croceicoccus ponticola]|uniref:DUF1214 domain-containing protein n=1 Tax=Croceicoccus ponticola TaxID=2217664 RepID=UPI0013E29706
MAEASLTLGTQQNGWTTNYRGPRFGTDWLLRAAVAKDQIYVAIPEEAVYPIGRVDADGRPLHGAKRYRIRFAADALPPVNAFWSITAYDDLGHMIPNPINRYSVGDRTAGLIREPDGSVVVTVASTPPAHGEGQNWWCQSDANLSPLGTEQPKICRSYAARFCHSASAAERRSLNVC